MATWIKSSSGCLVNLEIVTYVNVWKSVPGLREAHSKAPAKPDRVVAFNMKRLDEGGDEMVATETVILFEGENADCQKVLRKIQRLLSATPAAPQEIRSS